MPKPIKQIKSWNERKSGKIPHNYVTVNGITFDSQAEADRYYELRIMEKAGLIKNLECQPYYELIPPAKVPGHQSFRKHGYTADFRYVKDGEVIVEDVKSKRTREERDYIINRKLMWMLLGIYVHEVLK